MSNTQVGLRRDGSPYNDKECEEIILKLEQLLDGELDSQKKENVEEMINNCQYCLEQYNIEKSIRKLIKNGFQNIKVSTKLISNIKGRIRTSTNTQNQES